MTVTGADIIAKARSYIGKLEDGPDVPRMAREIGQAFPEFATYVTEATNAMPWCGDFVAYVLMQFGIKPPPVKDGIGFFYVDRWEDFGTPIPVGQEQPGDIAGFIYPPDLHHVTFVAGRGQYVGGNQHDAVTETHFSATPSFIRRAPVVAGVVDLHPEIKLGATGAPVIELQRLLGIAQSGTFDSATDVAVRSYQSAHGLDLDGEVGTDTWGSLLSGKPAEPTGSFPYSSKGSWYSQYDGKYHWHDGGDEPNSAALTGTPDDAQGISFYNHSTLGHWFEVLFPNGHTSIEQQTDIGPNPNTGRKIDISAAAAERAGYSPDDLHLPNAYPTDAIVKWRPIDVPAEVVSLSPVQQAIRYRDLRGSIERKPIDVPPPVLTVASLIAQIDAIADDLRKKADTLNSIRKALTEKTMADTTQPQIDWGAILQPVIKAVLPELMKVLPQILPQLLPLILPLLVNILTGRKAVAAVQASAPASSMPPGLVTGGLGLVGAILTSVLHSRGWIPADVADPATLIGLTAAGIGGGQAAKATIIDKPKQ